MTSRHKLAQAGFTLVELAIVLLIVGLLISGILKGQELIQNSRTTATIQQVKSYEAAINTFRDSFNALPGDIGVTAAQSRIPGCAATNTISCTGGNGDGVIGGANGATTASGGSSQDERGRFWQHLALANLITGIVTDFATNTVPSWGVTYPAGRLTGGFVVGQANSAAGLNGAAGPLNGHYVVLQAIPNAIANASPAIDPSRAVQIDLKLDDGLPGAGDVVGVGTGTTCASANTPIGTYAGGTQTATCALAIRVMN